MFDRRAWEAVCPSNCKKLGMSEALDVWATDAREPSDLTTYDDFVAAKAAINGLDLAIQAVEKKIDDAPKATTLLKNAKSISDGYAKKLRAEYQRRLNVVTAQLDAADLELSRKQDELDKSLVHAGEALKVGEKELKEFESRQEQDEELQEMLNTQLQVLKEWKKDAKDDFGVFRNRMANNDVRVRGAGGLCDDNAIGGDDRKQILKRFSEHMKAFQKLEATFDQVALTWRDMVVVAKNLATLADSTIKEVEKHKRILETVQGGLLKLYGLMEELRAKRAAVDGVRDSRKDPQYGEGMDANALRTEIKSLQDLTANLKGYVDQLAPLEERAETIVAKAINGIPATVTNRHRIRRARNAMQNKLEEEKQANLTKTDEWKSSIHRGETYVQRLERLLRELAQR